MKTLYGVVRGLKKLTKAKLREPKKFWCVTIQYGDLLWSCYISEQPTYKLLYEIWEGQLSESIKWFERQAGIGLAKKQESEIDAWLRQEEVAKKLMDLFFSYRNYRYRMGGVTLLHTYGITVEEEVLH